MKENVLLRKTINEHLEIIRNMEVGTEEYRIAVDALTKLLDREIEIEKLDFEHEVLLKSKKLEQQNRNEQMKEDKKSRLIGYVIKGLEIGIPIVVTIWGTKVSMRFEETGTITTTAGKSFFRNLFSKK